MKPLSTMEYVILDVETTGLSPGSGDRIVEIAALRVRGLEPAEEFHSLVNPQRNISWGAYAVNGISDEMIKSAPVFAEILPEVNAFLGDACVVAHNAGFDLGFIFNEFAIANHPHNRDWVILDTVRMSRTFLPHIGSHRLWYVAQALGIKIQQKHRALDDVYLTYQVFVRLLNMAKKKEIDDFPTLLKLCGQVRKGIYV